MSVVIDSLYIGYALFFMAIFIVVGYYLLSSLYAIDVLKTPTALAVLNSWKVWDIAFIALLVLLSLVAVILAYFTPTSPAFFIVYIIMLIIAVFIAPQYSNIYETFISDSNIAPSAAQFPNINHIIEILPIITLVVSSAIGIASYGKNVQRSMRGL